MIAYWITIVAQVILGIGAFIVLCTFGEGAEPSRDKVMSEEPQVTNLHSGVWDTYLNAMNRTSYIRFVVFVAFYASLFFIFREIQNSIVILFALASPFFAIIVINYCHMLLLRREKQKYVDRYM